MSCRVERRSHGCEIDASLRSVDSCFRLKKSKAAETTEDHAPFGSFLTRLSTSEVVRKAKSISAHLGWHRARLKLTVCFTSDLLKLPTTNPRGITTALKASVNGDWNYRPINYVKNAFIEGEAIGLTQLPDGFRIFKQSALCEADSSSGDESPKG